MIQSVAGKDLGLSLTDCQKIAKEYDIYQYKRAGNLFYGCGIYVRCTDNNRQHERHTILYLDADGVIQHLSTTTWHRTNILWKALKDGSINKVDSDVLDNYATGGYNTRRGLFANYDKSLSRIRRIALSHFHNTDRGEDAHNWRVQFRNNY